VEERKMTPNMYILILMKLGLFATLSAVVGISSWKILEKSRKGLIGRMVGYYLVVMLVVIWFMGLGGIIMLD
jgi:hypothetical protein